MRLTSSLHAAGAALGLLAGLTMNHPVDSAPLAGEVTPYEVAVVWRSPAPAPQTPAAGVQADDWGGRLPPTAEPSPERQRAPASRRAPRTPRPSARPTRVGHRAPAPPVLLGVEVTVAADVVNRDECSRARLARLAVDAARAAATTRS